MEHPGDGTGKLAQGSSALSMAISPMASLADKWVPLNSYVILIASPCPILPDEQQQLADWGPLILDVAEGGQGMLSV